jgi:ABC-type branched-subunit amino acid transport system ATPase component
MALLEVRNVSKYFGGLAALSNVDLAIDEGEIRPDWPQWRGKDHII